MNSYSIAMTKEIDTGESPTVSNVMARIRQHIFEGIYAPGQRLIEKDVVEEYGIGRGRAREVLKSLVGEGYLEFEENRGVRVRRLTRQGAIDIGRVREVIEGLAARLAAERTFTDEERSILADIQAQMDRATDERDAETFAHANRRFHDLIVQVADNSVLTKQLEILRVPIFRIQFQQSFTTASMGERNKDHQRITQALLDGDADAAEAAMRDHVRRGNARLVEFADRLFG